MNYIDWRGDPGRKAIALHDALMEIENRSLSEGAKVLVRKLIIDEMKKRRRGQPTRRFRDLSLAKAARRLMNQGYNPSRNDEMRDRECGASIIQKALARLGVSMTEKQVKDIVLKYLSVLK